ncbi:hypothetical protein BI375_23490 [Vibrio rotiferianus]|uniref:TFIIB-type domain-containing protein n=1 Tax=Vibrio rotiferianus TaxID=190895 RepID=A0ABX3D4B8_9VIBR|nr:glycine zipper domain-containing protein [Vibrio rotiferianus]OHY89562.1 hypothetical protein BI375_23490 [Vibrio rotiferianus]
MYKCPKCSSEDTYKEKINGMDTGDRVCRSCGHITSASSFKKNSDRAVGAATGGAILGASLGGPVGLVVGGLLGAWLGNVVDENKENNNG